MSGKQKPTVVGNRVKIRLPMSMAIEDRDAFDHLLRLIGVLVKLEREEDGWTQWELAEEAGVCTGTVSRLEKFKTKSPHLRTTIMILTALGHEIQVGRRADRVMDAIEKVG